MSTSKVRQHGVGAVANNTGHRASRAGLGNPRAADVLRQASRRRSLKLLEEWIDHELSFYVKDYISDNDYAAIRQNLIQIADAHAQRMSRQARLASRAR